MAIKLDDPFLSSEKQLFLPVEEPISMLNHDFGRRDRTYYGSRKPVSYYFLIDEQTIQVSSNNQWAT